MVASKRTALNSLLGSSEDENEGGAESKLPEERQPLTPTRKKGGALSSPAKRFSCTSVVPPPSPPPSPPPGSGYSPVGKQDKQATDKQATDTQRAAAATGREKKKPEGGVWRMGAGATSRTSRLGDVAEAEEDEFGDSFAVAQEAMGERAQPTAQQVVASRLGASNGRVRRAEEVLPMIKALSAMLAKRMPEYSSAVLSEMGNVMMALMDQRARAFAVELLLPWGEKLALKDAPEKATKLGVAREDELAAEGYCLARPGDCLSRVFEYTLEVTKDGLPAIVSEFWRTLALAAPPPPYRTGSPAHNVPLLSSWIGMHAHNAKLGDREKQTCLSLSLFLKGLSVKTRSERVNERADRSYAAALREHRRAVQAAMKEHALPPPPPKRPNKSPPRAEVMASAISILKETSQQRRRKSTRAELEEQVALQQEQQQQLQAAAFSRAQAGTAEADPHSDSEIQMSPAAAGAAARSDLMAMDGSEIEHRGAAMKIRDVREAPAAHVIGARVRPVPQMPTLRHERIPGLGGTPDNRQQHALAAGQGGSEATKAGEGPAAQHV